MRLKILESGGLHPTPKPLCKCNMCQEARKKGIPYTRGGCSLYIEDEKILIDTPIDIVNSLNREKISEITQVVYTHHHPNHILGAKLFEMMNYDYIKSKAIKKTNVYFPRGVLKRARKIIDEFEFSEKRKIIEVNEMLKKTKFGKISFTPFITDKEQNTYGFIIMEKGKKIIYAPCGNHNFPSEIANADLAIIYWGYLNRKNQGPEELLEEIIKRVKAKGVKKIIVTHIEEIRQLNPERAIKLGKEMGVVFA